MNKIVNVKVIVVACLFAIASAFAYTPVINTFANERSELPKFEIIAEKAKALGVKTGSDLVRDAVVHDSPYSFFYNSNEQVVDFASNILIFVDHPEQINTQTDLENYAHAQRDSQHYFGELFYSIDNPQIVAIWDGFEAPQALRDLFPMVNWYLTSDSSSGITFSPSASSIFVPSLEPGYRADPDGNCDDVYLCLRQDNGGQTGFHSYMSYLGRWEGVNAAITTEREVLIDGEARGNLTLAPWTINQFIPSETVVTVSVH
jgi:hypothetical protein